MSERKSARGRKGKKKDEKRDGVYTRPDRDGFWISWKDVRGRRHRRKTDAPNITVAKQILAAELLRVEQARMLGHQPPEKDTFEDVADRFLKHQKARLTPKAYDREEGIVRLHLKPIFGKRKLASIHKADIQKYVTDESGKRSNYSIIKELNVLKHIFNLAVEWEILPINPGKDVKGPKEPEGRVRYLQPKELGTLLEACPDGLQQIVALAASTGMRRGEIVNLRYLDVDTANRHIVLPKTKNGKGRIVHLNDLAMMVLRSVGWNEETKPDDRIFSDWTLDQVSVAFGRICDRLKLVDFRFHDLRHTTASWLRMSGEDIHTVAEILGHKDLRMARRYQHLSPGFLAKAVGKLDTVFNFPKALSAG